MADSKDTVVSCGDYYEKNSLSVSAMSNENQPPPPNRITPSRENSYWFAHSGGDEETAIRNNIKYSDNKEAQQQKEREERIRLFREQQEEERIKRLKELENSFELSRKYREQQEEERKRKIEEARIKETERRQQVEERKRQIWEAEQERKEAILRRNLEREARIEARRNAQRNSMSFAFGSSTPRTFDLDLAALGSAPLGCSLMSSVSVRRTEEKDVGVKRATSACSLDRKAEDSDFSSTCDDLTPNRCNRAASAEPELSIAKQIGIQHMKSDATKACLTMFDESSPFSIGTSFINCSSSRWLTGSGALVGDDCMSRSMISLSSASRGRRRTDLTPVMPRERSVTPHTVPRAKDSSRSPSRPPSAMSGRSEVSMTSSQSSSISLRPRPPPRKPRPVSIAGTTLSSVNLNNSWDKQIRSRESSGPPPLGPKPPRPKSSNLEAAVKNPVSIKKPIPPPKTAQVLAKAKSHPVPTKDNLRKGVKMPVEVKKELPNESGKELPNESKKEIPDDSRKELSNESRKELPNEVRKELFPNVSAPEFPSPLPDAKVESPSVQELSSELSDITISKSSDSLEETANQLPNPIIVEKPSLPSSENKLEQETAPNPENSAELESLQTKPRITSEEEARIALAEKRRLAREQAEREAELERQRQEELRRQEEERRIQEELEQKRQEEEQIRLAELHRKLEEEKLKKAIEEQQQREKEEQARKEEEAKLRMEREEQDRKAREEAERQRLELEERLRKEEQERAERKKRVEQIMSRTRNKSNAANNKQMVSPANESAPAAEINLLNQSKEFVMSSNVIMNSTLPENSVVLSGNDVTPQPNVFGNSVTQPLNLDILMTHSNVKNGFHGDSVDQSFVKNNTISSANCAPNRTPNSDAISPSQTNGYSSHEEMSVTSSPEDRSEKLNSSGGLLLNLQSAQPPPPNVIPRGLDDQLIDIGSSTNSAIDNYLIHPDVVNSNLVPSGDPFHTFESNLSKKQETAITDLLS